WTQKEKMNLDRISELNEALAKGTDTSLEIRFFQNKLILKKSTHRLEYIWWLILIIGIPTYYFWDNPTIHLFIIVSSLSLAFVYLIYDALLATNQLIIDLTNREVTIIPNDRIVSFLGLAKEKRIGFQDIQGISLGQKSNGRGQPPGRRLFIDTTTGKAIAAFDFRDRFSAKLFNHLLDDILKNSNRLYLKKLKRITTHNNTLTSAGL
ncbi:hypothetical protein, partial [Rufibacter latericius]